MKKFWIGILCAGIVLIAMSAYHYLTRPGEGDPAPAFSLPAVGGATVDLTSYRGKPVILHFWASWCGVCQAELPALVRFGNALGGEAVFLAIAEDEAKGRPGVEGLARGMRMRFPVLLDADGTVADAYQSYSVPETILVDANGLIRWRHAGPVDWDGGGVLAKIRDLNK